MCVTELYNINIIMLKPYFYSFSFLIFNNSKQLLSSFCGLGLNSVKQFGKNAAHHQEMFICIKVVLYIKNIYKYG